MPTQIANIALTKAQHIKRNPQPIPRRDRWAITDRRIAFYQKLGYYSSGIVKFAFKEKVKEKRKQSFEKLYAGF